MRVLGGLSIDVLAVSDADDEYQQLIVTDRVHDPVSPHADPVTFTLPSKFLAPDRSRLICQRQDSRHDALPVSLLVNGLDLPGRGRLNQDPITCHAA